MLDDASSVSSFNDSGSLATEFAGQIIRMHRPDVGHTFEAADMSANTASVVKEAQLLFVPGGQPGQWPQPANRWGVQSSGDQPPEWMNDTHDEDPTPGTSKQDAQKLQAYAVLQPGGELKQKLEYKSAADLATGTTVKGVIQSVDVEKGILVLRLDSGQTQTFSDLTPYTLQRCQAAHTKAQQSNGQQLAQLVINVSPDGMERSITFTPGLTPAPDGRKNLAVPSAPAQQLRPPLAPGLGR